jgi:L-2-hydroxyglutarate oxidase LhgO
VSGRHELYQYCDQRRLRYRRCGKLVVAIDASEDAYLVRLQQQANANGVEELELIGASRMRSLETQLRGTSACYVPNPPRVTPPFDAIGRSLVMDR